jgi:arsenate reductase
MIFLKNYNITNKELIIMNNNKPKVAFICVHNSCRSQMAEALGKHFASEVFESYSAGTETKPQINQDAVRLMKKIYNIDMEEKQYSKLITELPEIDIKITMGCNVICPFVDSKYEEDWGLDDPTGKSDEEFEKVITQIEKNIKELADKVSNHKLY